jgi:hypothetical protein
MPCQGRTKSGKPCRNPATANGYCRLHGGIPTRAALRKSAQLEYDRMTPEQQRATDRANSGCLLTIVAIVLVLAAIYGSLTGDWKGVGRWMSR